MGKGEKPLLSRVGKSVIVGTCFNDGPRKKISWRGKEEGKPLALTEKCSEKNFRRGESILETGKNNRFALKRLLEVGYQLKGIEGG